MIQEYKRVTVKPLSYNGKWKDVNLYLHHDYNDVKMSMLMEKGWKEITKKL